MSIAAPTNVRVAMLDGQYVFVLWDSVPGAISYTLHHTRSSDSNTGWGTTIYNITTPFYTISAVELGVGLNNTDIHFYVTATDGITTSPFSVYVAYVTAILYNTISVSNINYFSPTTITAGDQSCNITLPFIYVGQKYTVTLKTGNRNSIHVATITTSSTNISFAGLTNGVTYAIDISIELVGHIYSRVNFAQNRYQYVTPTQSGISYSASIPYDTSLSTFTVNGINAYDGSRFALPNGTTSVTAVYVPADSTASVMIAGDTGLVTGINTLTATVTTSGGQTSVSTVTLIVYAAASATAVCFLGDAPVLTASGYRPIREFAVGDSVMTADGREVAVSRVFSRRYGPSATVNPYVIPKGVLGATRPLAISPNHEVMVAGKGMVKARDLGLNRMKMTEEFTYYNLELEDWVRDNLVVAGVTCESLAPAARMTMTKAEFARFVTSRYGPEAAARLRLQSVCFEEADGRVSMPAIR